MHHFDKGPPGNAFSGMNFHKCIPIEDTAHDMLILLKVSPSAIASTKEQYEDVRAHGQLP